MTTTWTPVHTARNHILSQICPIEEAESCAVEVALWRVLADDIIAPFNVPGHDNSAMDGFAAHFDDVNKNDVTLRIVGSSFAGHPFAGGFDKGECVKIMTGARLPDNTTIIVPQEQTTNHNDGTVTIYADNKRYSLQHLRFAGEDIKQSNVALAAGQLLKPADIGLIASLGIANVNVRRRLKIAFFSSGDEVQTIGQTLKNGDVYDSNRHTLRAMIQRMGFEAIDFGVVKDDRESLMATIAKIQAEKVDVVITSGGVSVGEADYIRDILASCGSVLFWKVAMRPGRPLAYGKIGKCDFFGLPGNPVSVMVCFYQFVAPALWKRSHRSSDTVPLYYQARTTTQLKKQVGRMEFQRGVLAPCPNGHLTVTVTGDQGSGILSSMSAANAFIILDDDVGRVDAGDWVKVQPFEGII